MMTLKRSDLFQKYSGKRVLVTGHTGFKGSWLTYILSQLGAEVFGYSIEEPEDKRHSYYALGIHGIVKNPDSHLADVRSLDALKVALQSAQPEYLFHLAAQPIVSTSYADPYNTFTSNILGTLNVLELLKLEGGDTTAVIITSDKCYKNVEREEAYVESDEMGGDDPYSASKGAAELVFHSYNVSFPKMAPSGMCTGRAGNVFGGGDWSRNRLIPDCARELFTRGVVDIRMPDAVRPWTFVVDILFGYLILGASLRTDPARYRGSWNFASGETKTVEQVVELFIESLGTGRLNVNKATAFGKEAGLLLIDPTKANQELGWTNVLSVDAALGETAKWYKAQNEGANMDAYSREFLQRYYLGADA
ncbi:CDP-glucose 4,6-dehydratase [Asticcacaulis sp.]|uniref:CDP-glucose 4,6-dehydratase n=1 Tax=Asticcacaulis sp. TaxID=1872648 RepID=UPI0031D634E5